MTPYRIRFTPTAVTSIRHLHPSVKQAVREAIRGLHTDPLTGHPLSFELAGFRSLRVSRYRIIYRIHDPDRALEIHMVGPRKDIYEIFRQLLHQLPQA